MSRKEIESLLDLIFSEKGIVKWILKFDDYPFDLIRQVLDNPKLHKSLPHSYLCRQCGVESAISIFLVPFLITWCKNGAHLEFSSKSNIICLSSKKQFQVVWPELWKVSLTREECKISLSPMLAKLGISIE